VTTAQRQAVARLIARMKATSLSDGAQFKAALEERNRLTRELCDAGVPPPVVAQALGMSPTVVAAIQARSTAAPGPTTQVTTHTLTDR